MKSAEGVEILHSFHLGSKVGRNDVLLLCCKRRKKRKKRIFPVRDQGEELRMRPRCFCSSIMMTGGKGEKEGGKRNEIFVRRRGKGGGRISR